MPIAYTSDPRWSHAGGVTYRPKASGFEILIVRASVAPHEWVLPKGHIEAGEQPHQCARREIQEEAGVDAEPRAFLGQDVFSTPAGQSVRSGFFLMEFLKDIPATESREIRWCAFGEALTLIQFEGARKIIRAAQDWLDGNNVTREA